MISTVGEFLDRLVQREREILGSIDIQHGPTIGDMYEGLSKEILERVIPEEFGLRIVSGFIEGASGSKSPEIDCMLVRGDGLEIPYTDKYVWVWEM